MFNRNSLRTILLVIGSICIAAWAIEQLGHQMPPANFAIPPASTPIPEDTSSQFPSPPPAPDSSPEVPTPSVAPTTEPTVRRGELVPKKKRCPTTDVTGIRQTQKPSNFSA